jgi:hypothetical protein
MDLYKSGIPYLACKGENRIIKLGNIPFGS